MPRGGPDDEIQENSLGQTIIDNAELAARLKSFDVVHRTGNVIYMTDFNNGIGDWLTSFIAPSDVGVRYDKGLREPGCAYILPSDSNLAISSLNKELPFLDSSTFGIELGLCFESVSVQAAYKIAVQLAVYTSSGIIAGIIYIYPKLNKLSVLDYTGGSPHEIVLTTSIPNMYGSGTNWLFNWVKLIVSQTKGMYVRCFFNNQVFDLSGYVLYTTSTSSPNMLYVSLSVQSDGNQEYVDIADVVVTMNEPSYGVS